MSDAPVPMEGALSNPPAKPVAVDPTQERFRVAVLATSVPLILLTAPCFLAFDHDRSLLTESRGDPGVILLIAAIYGWPLFVGALGLRRALRDKPPGKAAFGVPAALHAIGAVLCLFLLMMAFTHGETREPAAWGALFAWLGVIAMVVRGIVRPGWERWASLVAAVWLSHAGVMLIAGAAQSWVLAAPTQAVWVVLFALAAAAVPLGWAMGPRRRDPEPPTPSEPRA